jgi:hypothetical protein
MTEELQGPEKATLARLLNAGSAKEGYDIWGSSYERPGAAALAKAGVGNKNMYPAFGKRAAPHNSCPPVSSRQAVFQWLTHLPPLLYPAALAAAYGGGGLPANVAATGGLYNAPASDPNDITAMLPKLMAQAKSMGLVNSPSQMLANMSAGFLGGKGPAQSLAGGFAGLAKSQGQDQEGGLRSSEAGYDCGAWHAGLSRFIPSPLSPTLASLCLRRLPRAVCSFHRAFKTHAGSDVHGDEFVKSHGARSWRTG